MTKTCPARKTYLCSGLSAGPAPAIIMPLLPAHIFSFNSCRRAVWLWALLLSVPFYAQSQSQQEAYLRETVGQHHFDHDKWKALTKDLDYSKEKVEKRGKPAQRKRTSPAFAQIFKYLAIACGIGLLVYLIVKMANGDELFGPRDRKLKSFVSGINLEAIEDNLPEAELQDPIRQAVAAGDYTLAVRLHYLAILKELSLKKHIKWQRDKTNGEYLRELRNSPLFPAIMEATLIFERIWYGKAELEQHDFFALEKQFIKTSQAIQPFDHTANKS